VSQKTRTQLKQLFSQGNIVSQDDFSDLIDSFWNLSDNGSVSGETGATGATGATGPFLGGNYGELFSNTATGAFSFSMSPAANVTWTSGRVGNLNGITGVNGVFGVTNASLTIGNTGMYMITVSANLIMSINSPGNPNDPLRVQLLVNSSIVPKLIFDVSYDKASWTCFCPFNAGDKVEVRFTNRNAGSINVSTGSFFVNILQIQ
jgi:hypothetical protein